MMRLLLLLLAMLLPTSALAQAGCPAGVPTGSLLCQPNLAPPLASDLIGVYRPSLGANGFGQYPVGSIMGGGGSSALPTWTTAGRPPLINPTIGYNSTLNQLDLWTGAAWQNFSSPAAIGNGTPTTGVFTSVATSSLDTSSGALTIGNTIATGVTIGKSGITSTILGTAAIGAASSTAFERLIGASSTNRIIEWYSTTLAHGLWHLQMNNTAETGNNQGALLELDAFNDSGTLTGITFQAERASGPLGQGKPQITSLASFQQNLPPAIKPGSAWGDDQEWGNSADVQPTLTLGSNPLIVTTGSPTVTVKLTNCCVANGTISTTVETWVDLLGAAAVGGIIPTGWLKVQSIVDNNDFTVTWTSNATSNATGGGSSVTIQPSFYNTGNKVFSGATTGGNGFTNQTTELWDVNPSFYQLIGQAIPKYLQRWEVTVGPNDTTQANGWAVAGVEWDLVNRGADFGYHPNYGDIVDSTIGIYAGATVVPGWVSGGGTAANWNTVYSVYSENGTIGVYDALNVQPDALVGAAQDPASHGGVGVDVFGSYLQLNAGAYGTTISTSTITLTVGLHSLDAQTNGNQVYIPKTHTFNGVTFGSGLYTMSNITVGSGSSTFTITGSGTASVTGTFTGVGDWLAFENLVPYAPNQAWGRYKHGLITTNFSAESGGVVETQPGAGVLWSDGTGTSSITGTSTSAGNIGLSLTTAGTGPLNLTGPWTANGSASVSLTNLAPSGAHATVQEWLTVTDSSGVTRYVPAF